MAALAGAGIAGIGSIIAGKKQNKAAEQSADAITQAAQIGANAQRQGFVDTTRLQQGRAQAGDAATARMMQILGLPVPDSLTSGSAYESIYSNAGGLGGGGKGANFDANSYFSKYGDVKSAWEGAKPEDIEYIQDRGYEPTAQGFAQYHYDTYGKAEGRTIGDSSSANGLAGGGGGGQYALNVENPGVNGLTAMIQNTPGYKFRMKEGINAIDSSAASRGMLLSGSQLKRLQDFGSEYAAQEFDKYWNRLAGVAGAGQTATGDISGAAQQNAANQANIANQQGQGLASSYGQQTSGFGNALGVVGGALGQYYGGKDAGA